MALSSSSSFTEDPDPPPRRRYVKKFKRINEKNMVPSLFQFFNNCLENRTEYEIKELKNKYKFLEGVESGEITEAVLFSLLKGQSDQGKKNKGSTSAHTEGSKSLRRSRRMAASKSSRSRSLSQADDQDQSQSQAPGPQGKKNKRSTSVHAEGSKSLRRSRRMTASKSSRSRSLSQLDDQGSKSPHGDKGHEGAGDWDASLGGEARGGGNKVQGRPREGDSEGGCCRGPIDKAG